VYDRLCSWNVLICHHRQTLCSCTEHLALSVLTLCEINWGCLRTSHEDICGSGCLVPFILNVDINRVEYELTYRPLYHLGRLSTQSQLNLNFATFVLWFFSCVHTFLYLFLILLFFVFHNNFLRTQEFLLKSWFFFRCLRNFPSFVESEISLWCLKGPEYLSPLCYIIRCFLLVMCFPVKFVVTIIS